MTLKEFTVNDKKIEPSTFLMDKVEMGNKLKQIRELRRISRDDASNLVGIGRTTLQKWEDGTREASLEVIGKLANLYQVDILSLILKENYSKDKARNKSQDLMEDYCLIPAYDIEVSAGHGAFSDGAIAPSRRFAFRKRWVQARGLDPKQLSAVFARGDSMEPTIKNGATVVIDHRKTRAMDGNIYVIRIDDRLWIKRTQWLIGGGLRLISDNNVYQPMDISKEELSIDNNFEVIGQVIHTAHDFPD